MGAAISQVEIAQRLMGAAGRPIHNYIQQVIPLLEYRQQAARRHETAKSEDERQACEYTIKLMNKKIALVLDMPPDKIDETL